MVERNIKLKIPNEIITQFENERGIIESIPDVGVYDAKRLEKDLKEGALIKINRDLIEILEDKEEFLDSNFMLEYHSYIKYALSKIMESSNLDVYGNNMIDVYRVLGITQEVLNTNNDIKDCGVLSSYALQKSWVYGKPSSYNKKIERMCDIYVAMGTGRYVPEVFFNINYEDYLTGKKTNLKNIHVLGKTWLI